MQGIQIIKFTSRQWEDVLLSAPSTLFYNFTSFRFGQRVRISFCQSYVGMRHPIQYEFCFRMHVNESNIFAFASKIVQISFLCHTVCSFPKNQKRVFLFAAFLLRSSNIGQEREKGTLIIHDLPEKPALKTTGIFGQYFTPYVNLQYLYRLLTVVNRVPYLFLNCNVL